MEQYIESIELEKNKASRPTIFWVLGLFVAFLLGMGAGYLVWVSPLQAQLASVQITATHVVAAEATEQQQAVEQQNSTQQPSEKQVKRYSVPIDDDPILGSEDARITIIEFSDYECPFCKQWHLEVWPKIQEKYGDQVRLVYRDFPLSSIHANAIPAAEAANCAGEQDQYWGFNEQLLSGDMEFNRTSYEKMAQNLNLDLASFQECLDENRFQKEVEDDMNYAAELGVRSTPTFFINGLAVVGAQPFDVFEKIIDMELAGEIP